MYDEEITVIKLYVLLVLTCLSGCVKKQLDVENSSILPQQLPIAVSNNAVAYVSVDGADQFYTFNGLLAGKTYQDITNQAYVWKKGRWQQLTVPDSQLPVLASVAVTANGHVYLFGGYTVAEDHSEKSIPNVWKIDPHTDHWTAMPSMPTPVDDTVALVYKDRYIYLISGWHDVGNVDLVQVFDTVNQTWHQATAFPLPPVFGHAGGILGDHMVICDGVKAVRIENKNHFSPSPACAIGQISDKNLTQIDWQIINHHSGTAFYRMAAAGDDLSKIYFMAGSDNPYNYDGIGYNTLPAVPSNQVRIYDIDTKKWLIVDDSIPASMDHRGLMKTPQGFVILGGMAEQQNVINTVTYYKEQNKREH